MTATLSLDDARTSLALPGDPRSVREARGFVRGWLTDRGLAELVDDASLVVTELATNAVLHAHSFYTVTALRHAGAVRLEVHDGDDRIDADGVRASVWTTHQVSGRGLALVDALTRDWGVETDATGKTVWAVLAA